MSRSAPSETRLAPAASSVAAVVVTCNRLQLLKKCILALRAQTHPLNCIIVVDNDSTDGTRDWLDQQPDLVRLSQDNRGSAGGQASGMRAAYNRKVHWIWCMDDDVRPTPTALSVMLRAAERARDVVCIVPGRVDEAGAPVLGHEKVSDRRWYSLDDFVNPRDWSAPIDRFTFEGPLIAREAVERIGFPDERYFLLYDDVDYAHRLSGVGNCYFRPDAQMVKMLPIVGDFDKGAATTKQYYRWRNYVFFMRRAWGVRAIPKIAWRLARDLQRMLRACVRERSLKPLRFLPLLSPSVRDGWAGRMGKVGGPVATGCTRVSSRGE